MDRLQTLPTVRQRELNRILAKSATPYSHAPEKTVLAIVLQEPTAPWIEGPKDLHAPLPKIDAGPIANPYPALILSPLESD